VRDADDAHLTKNSRKLLFIGVSRAQNYLEERDGDVIKNNVKRILKLKHVYGDAKALVP
jgi:hypothetical protein